MVEHGEYDRTQGKWFCTYWMDYSSWIEIHGYAPKQQSNESDIPESVNNDEIDEQNCLKNTLPELFCIGLTIIHQI